MKLFHIAVIVILLAAPVVVRAQQQQQTDSEDSNDLESADDQQQQDQYDDDSVNNQYGDDPDRNTSPSSLGDEEADASQQDEDLTTGSATDNSSNDQEPTEDDSPLESTTESPPPSRNSNKSSNKNNNAIKSSKSPKSQKSSTTGRSRKNQQQDEDEQSTSTSNPNDDDYQPPTKNSPNQRGGGRQDKSNSRNNKNKKKSFDFSSGAQFNGEGSLEDDTGDSNEEDNQQQDFDGDQYDGEQKSGGKNSTKNSVLRAGKQYSRGKQQQDKSKSGRQQQQQQQSGTGGSDKKKQQRNDRRIYANFTEQTDFSGMEGGGMGGGRDGGQMQQIEPINVDYFPKYEFKMVTQTLPFEVTVTRVNTINVPQTRPVMLMETSVISSTVLQNVIVHTSAETVSTLTMRAPLTAGATRFRTIVQPTTTVIRSSSVVTSTVQDTPFTVYITQTGEPYCFFADVRPTVIIRTQVVTEATQHYLTQTMQNNMQLGSPQDRFPLVNATADATIYLTKTRFHVHAKTEHRNVTITSMTAVLKRNVTTLQVPVTKTLFTTMTNTIGRTVTITDYDLPPNAVQQQDLATDIVLTTITPTYTRTEPILRTKLITNQITVYSSVYEPSHECQRVGNFNVTHTVLAVTTTTSRVTLYQYQVATYAFNEFDGKFNASQAAAARNATMQARMAQQQQLEYFSGNGSSGSGGVSSGRQRQRGNINATRTYGSGNRFDRYNGNALNQTRAPVSAGKA